ncbi:MAG: hypothetical protein WCP98_01010 [Actinomycetes bacterium]
MIADHHIHTGLRPHAEGEPRQYVERAIGRGTSAPGFADPPPLPAGWAPCHGSGAHHTREVGGAFEEAAVTAREAGYAAGPRLAGGGPEPL